MPDIQVSKQQTDIGRQTDVELSCNSIKRLGRTEFLFWVQMYHHNHSSRMRLLVAQAAKQEE